MTIRTDTHFENCPYSSPDPVRWVCEHDHWLAWDIPPGVGDQCPFVFHDANTDGRCVGALAMADCICRDLDHNYREDAAEHAWEEEHGR